MAGPAVTTPVPQPSAPKRETLQPRPAFLSTSPATRGFCPISLTSGLSIMGAGGRCSGSRGGAPSSPGSWAGGGARSKGLSVKYCSAPGNPLNPVSRPEADAGLSPGWRWPLTEKGLASMWGAVPHPPSPQSQGTIAWGKHTERPHLARQGSFGTFPSPDGNREG